MAPEDRTTVSGAIFKIPENVVSTHPQAASSRPKAAFLPPQWRGLCISPLPPPALPFGIL